MLQPRLYTVAGFGLSHGHDDAEVQSLIDAGELEVVRGVGNKALITAESAERYRRRLIEAARAKAA